MTSPTVAGALPADILARSQATRATFGPKVALKFAAWPGGQAGNRAYDNPGYDPRDSLEARRRAGDVIEPDFDTGDIAGGALPKGGAG